ncbi:peptide-methionine (S)-S-oxide reductase [Batrachochytrium salamandrivorans]|nr:peptide-methionine (S)-S-oxide reductase [Batrachochytrium salamandrivorans]
MGNESSASMMKTAMDLSKVDPSLLVHFVLGTSLAPALVPPIRKLVVSTGCYWGSEKSFWRLPGVVSTSVGSCGGGDEFKFPSYELVCSGATGHAESVIVFYNSDVISFADLMRQFLQSHDPSQRNGQGNDHGTQYRSAVFLDDEEEVKFARLAIAEYERLLKRKIHTQVVHPQPPFYYAEEYMQQYLAKPGSRPYCSAQPQGVSLVWGDWSKASLIQPKLPEAFWDKHSPIKGCVLREPNEQIVWPPSPPTSKQ